MSSTVTIHEDPLDNPHRYVEDVHYRLYLRKDGTPTTICAQWFDYRDYDDNRFLTTDAYTEESDAQAALAELLLAALRTSDERASCEAVMLGALSAPLTRAQAVAFYVSREKIALAALPGATWPDFEVTPEDVVLVLRDDGDATPGAEAVVLGRTLGDLPGAQTIAQEDAGTALTWAPKRPNAIIAATATTRYVITLI